MESLYAAGDDQRIPELELAKYENQASYVIRRDQTQTLCATPELKSNSIRTATFNIVDGNFLDLSTLFFSFKVNNKDTVADHTLRPASAIPHCWFRRLIIKCNGSTVEDIMHLSRVEEQMTRFVSTNKRRNWGDAGHGWEELTDAGIDALSKPIGVGGSQRVTWRPVSSGFLQCGRYIPMMGGAGGLSFELELADPTEAVVNTANKSTDWSITNFTLHVDSVQLTSEVTNSFADTLTNQPIIIPYQANSVDVQYLTGGPNVVLTLAKQFSRLASVFVSLENAPADAITDNAAGALKKSMNNFYLPAGSAEAVASHITVNNMRWPNFDNEGTKQHYMRLQHCVGVWNSLSHGTNISADGFGNGTVDSTQFVFGFDLETVPHAEASGISVQGGGHIQVDLKNIGGAGGAGGPIKAYIMTHYDAALEIRSQGSIVYS
jgi:hypothetical protein